MEETSSVKVAIRVRPFNARESNSTSITAVNENTIFLTNPDDKKKKNFSYDFAYDTNATQEMLYNDIGTKVIDCAYAGYNSCVFAYGQTGCFAKGTQIMLINGKYKSVEDITTDDVLMGDDSTPRNVKKLFRGRQQMYQVSSNISGHTPYVVNEDHIMLFDNNNSIVEMPLHKYLDLPDYLKKNYMCYTKGVSFPYQKTYIDPYTFGSELDHSHEYIPDCFKYNSYASRAALLKGIYSNKSYKCPALIEDIAWVMRSLGLVVSINDKCEFDTSNNNLFRPTIKSLGEGDYYGFMLDGNHRFIGAGFNVLRNSGKSHTMSGGNDPASFGIIPRICQQLFEKQNTLSTNITYRAEVSYMEIYSEEVNDLLRGNVPKTSLRVRQHPTYGPYVEGLSQIVVEDYNSVKRLIDQGNKERTTASTKMNDRSSRSHAIMTIYFTQIVMDPTLGKAREIVSKINLVDLAGSERVEASGVTGINFKEAIDINKSLHTLGLVISQLATRAAPSAKSAVKSAKKTTEPDRTEASFRSSVLTWLLKESLGGNSKTYMIATVSPASINYNETLSTLRYASNAKQIVNVVKVNEDTNNKIIKQLNNEIVELRRALAKKESGVSSDANNSEIQRLRDEIHQREILMQTTTKSWEQKLEESRAHQTELKEQHKQELALRQAEFIKKEQEMAAERDVLYSEVEQMKSTMNEKELQQQRELENQLKQTQLEYENKQSKFEKERIVEAAMDLSEKYEIKLNAMRQSYEEQLRIKADSNIVAKLEAELKQKTMALEAAEAALVAKQHECDLIKAELQQTNLDAQKLSLELINSDKQQLAELTEKNNALKLELQTQLRQFTSDRAILSKQIQQLQAKIHQLEQMV